MPRINEYPDKNEIDGNEELLALSEGKVVHIKASLVQGSTAPPGAGSSWGAITGDIANQGDLQYALSSKSDTSHDHEGAYSSAGHTHAVSSHAGTHAEGQSDPVSPSAIGAADAAHNHNGVYSSATHNHDSAYSSATHAHAYSDHASCHATGGGDALTPGNIGASPSGHAHEGTYSSATHAHEGTYSSAAHNHASTYATLGHAHEGTYSSAAHAHAAATSGAAGFLPALAGTTTTFLRADGTWSTTPTAGVASSWGAITGTLSNQADLQTALDGKASSGHAHEGTYSSAAHAHEGTYSSASHNHSSTYATLGHNHDGTYSSASHVHAAFSTAGGAAGFTPGSAGGTANFLRADGSWAAPPGGGASSNTPQILTRVFNVVSSNSSAVTNLINYSVPAKTLETNRMLRFTAIGDLRLGSTAVSNAYTFEAFHAGSSRWKAAATTLAGALTNPSPFMLQMNVAAVNSSASRYMTGMFAASSGTAATFGIGALSLVAGMRMVNTWGSSATYTITTGAAESFQVAFNWAAANSSLAFNMRYGVLELI